MPSPFPGMDPYLENPAYFGDFHDSFIVHLSEFLQGSLPDRYFASLGTRVWVDIVDRYMEPDVKVLSEKPPPREGASGALAVQVELRTPPIVVTVPQDECRESYIDILTLDERTLVTTIELLSPSNKTPGTQGRDLYRRKQGEILAARVHLVEIDLLRGGQHATAVPLDRLRRSVGGFDHHVCVHRFDRPEDFLIYPVLLKNPLPEIAIPLLPGDGDVALDLQKAFERCYDARAYRKMIRYGADPLDPPLAPDLADWLQDILARNRAAP